MAGKIKYGEVSEWSKVIDSKSIVRQRTVGSNPTLSAMNLWALRVFLKALFYFQNKF